MIAMIVQCAVRYLVTILRGDGGRGNLVERGVGGDGDDLVARRKGQDAPTPALEGSIP